MNPTFKDFRVVSSHFGSHPEIKNKVAEYFRSQEFQDYINGKDDNTEDAVRLTLILLKAMSVSAHKRDESRSFIDYDEDTVLVNIYFHGVINVVGAFVLPANSPHIEVLRLAIEENRASKMYKAAKMQLRLRDKTNKYCRRISDASSKYLKDKMEGAKLWPVPLECKDEHSAAYWRYHEFLDTTSREADEQELKHRERLFNRIRSISDQVFAPAYRGNFKEWMIWFAMEYIYPSRIELNTH